MMRRRTSTAAAAAAVILLTCSSSGHAFVPTSQTHRFSQHVVSRPHENTHRRRASVPLYADIPRNNNNGNRRSYAPFGNDSSGPGRGSAEEDAAWFNQQVQRAQQQQQGGRKSGMFGNNRNMNMNRNMNNNSNDRNNPFPGGTDKRFRMDNRRSGGTTTLRNAAAGGPYSNNSRSQRTVPQPILSGSAASNSWYRSGTGVQMPGAESAGTRGNINAPSSANLQPGVRLSGPKPVTTRAPPPPASMVGTRGQPQPTQSQQQPQPANRSANRNTNRSKSRMASTAAPVDERRSPGAIPFARETQQQQQQQQQQSPSRSRSSSSSKPGIQIPKPSLPPSLTQPGSAIDNLLSKLPDAALRREILAYSQSALVGAFVGPWSLFPASAYHYLVFSDYSYTTFAQWEWDLIAGSVQSACFAVLYRYALREDLATTWVQRKVWLSAVLLRSVVRVTVPYECAAGKDAPLYCVDSAPLYLVNGGMMSEMTMNAVEGLAMFGIVAVTMNWLLERNKIARY